MFNAPQFDRGNPKKVAERDEKGKTPKVKRRSASCLNSQPLQAILALRIEDNPRSVPKLPLPSDGPHFYWTAGRLALASWAV